MRSLERTPRSASLYDGLHTVPAKHFLPENQAPAVAEVVAALTARAG